RTTPQAIPEAPAATAVLSTTRMSAPEPLPAAFKLCARWKAVLSAWMPAPMMAYFVPLGTAIPAHAPFSLPVQCGLSYRPGSPIGPHWYANSGDVLAHGRGSIVNQFLHAGPKLACFRKEKVR